MKTLMAIGLVVWLASNSCAQKSQTEVIKSSGEQEDKRSNSDAVPDVISQSLQFERIVLVRFKHKTDLLAGLEKAVAEQKIVNGVILAGLGSVRGFHFHGVSNREFPSANFYIKNPTHPADIVSVNGMVLAGRIHAHMTLADDVSAFGGHLEAGTDVFTFACISIGVLPEKAELSRLDDKTYR